MKRTIEDILKLFPNTTVNDWKQHRSLCCIPKVGKVIVHDDNGGGWVANTASVAAVPHFSQRFGTTARPLPKRAAEVKADLSDAERQQAMIVQTTIQRWDHAFLTDAEYLKKYGKKKSKNRSRNTKRSLTCS